MLDWAELDKTLLILIEKKLLIYFFYSFNTFLDSIGGGVLENLKIRNTQYLDFDVWFVTYNFAPEFVLYPYIDLEARH